MNHEQIIGKEALGKGIKLSDLERAGRKRQTLFVEGLDGTALTIFFDDANLIIREGKYLFWADFRRGTLYLNIKNEIDGQRSNNIFPAQLLRFITNEWRDKIGFVKGNWSSGTNIRLFREAVKAGKSPEEAALATWTGQVVSALGFSQVIEVYHSAIAEQALFARGPAQDESED